MKKLLLAAPLVVLAACSTADKPREHLDTQNCVIPAAEIAQEEGAAKPGKTYAWQKSDKGQRSKAFQQYFLDRTPGGGAISFARVRGGKEPGASWPVLYSHGKSGWREIQFKRDFRGWEWTYVTQDFERGRIWGILESAVEGGAHQLPIIASSDGGKTWHLQAYVPKPRYTALLNTFKMSPGGEGGLSFALEASECRNSKDLPAGARAIFYARTSDGGEHWALQPDAEIDAALDRPRGPSLDCVEAFEALKPLPSHCTVR